MYKLIKRIYITICPSVLRSKLDTLVRKLIYIIIYRGNNYKCNICDANLKKFIQYKFDNSDDLICPKCGSLSRTRALCLYIENEIPGINKMLEFSPHRCFYDYWTKKDVEYIANDFENEFLAHTHHSITSMPFDDRNFDLILCYHILEHIKEDDKAIKELFRILSESGVLLIQVPFKSGSTLEDLSITSPEKRKELYGQEDHVRYYGKKDFIDKLKLYGFDVNACLYTESLSDEKISCHGLNKLDTIFVCKIKS